MAPTVGIYTPFLTIFLAAGYFGLDQVLPCKPMLTRAHVHAHAHAHAYI